jgi:anti-sigma-K factor RskA
MVMRLERRVRGWRTAAIGAMALAAGLAGFIISGPILVAPPGGRYVALLEGPENAPAFIATVDLDAGGLSLRQIGGEAPAGKDFELWAVGGGRSQPQSLGLITAGYRLPLKRLTASPGGLADTVLAVSLEPDGGSPTGLPTGPVVYSGKLWRSE